MINSFYALEPYSLDSQAKKAMVTQELLDITRLHYESCPPYRNILDGLGFKLDAPHDLYDIPFFPVRLFKDMELMSIPPEKIFKVMTSSGTTGQAVSRIFLDMETAMAQQKVLVKILSNYIGNKRLPMLVVDSPATVQNRQMFTARGAAIIGLDVVSRKQVFALDENMQFKTDTVVEFLREHEGQRFLIFGFTFMLWQHFYKELYKIDEKFDLSEAFLMSSGGWKKLQENAVSSEEFKASFNQLCGMEHFLDHYAMVEQTGCIYAECECGHLHASIYSDIIPRRYKDFSPCEIGEPGIVQLLSVIPRSYPGHSLITEDEGVILGEDNCPCGRKGKYFRINGRIKSAELRGCSDTYAAKFQ